MQPIYCMGPNHMTIIYFCLIVRTSSVMLWASIVAMPHRSDHYIASQYYTVLSETCAMCTVRSKVTALPSTCINCL